MKLAYRLILSLILIIVSLYVIIKVIDIPGALPPSAYYSGNDFLYVILEIIDIPGATPPSVYYSSQDFLVPIIIFPLLILLIISNLLLKKDNKFITSALVLPSIYLFTLVIGWLLLVINPPRDSETVEGLGILGIVIIGPLVFIISILLLIISLFKKKKI